MKSKNLLLMLSGIFVLSLVSAATMPDPFGDYDSDGVFNIEDNCYYVYNPFQTDNDNNGYGNCCDPNYILEQTSSYCDDPNQLFCGDGFCNNGETSLTCAQDCSSQQVFVCGNGIVETSEQCDDGNTNFGDGCSSTCTLEDSNNQTTKNFWKGSRRCESGNCVGGINSFEQFCDVNWYCSGWGSCINGVKKRTCVETNGCEYNYNQPPEVIPCPISEKSFADDRTKISTLDVSFVIMLVLLAILLVTLIIKNQN